MPELPQVYNSRILKSYIGYLNKHHPDIDIESILKHAGISKYEMDDHGHWFNQQEIDRFHEKIVELTCNPGISREAGHFAVVSDSSGPVKQHALGLLRVSTIYLLLAKLYPMMSRGAQVTSQKISPNQVEIVVVPKPDIEEKPYQCENRIGIFESIPKLYHKKFAIVEHPKCVHKGDESCNYLITWEKSAYPQWRRLFTIGFGLGAALLTATIFLWPLHIWLTVFFASGVGLMGLYLRSLVMEKRELTRAIQSQGNAAEDLIQEIDYRYRGARLIQKIGQATSAILDIDELGHLVMQYIENYLDFDRGLMMLADEKRGQLFYSAGFGFDDAMVDLLAKTQFRLDRPGARGVFVKVYNDQRPVLVDDIRLLSPSFSSKSQQLVDRIGSKSLICLPIVHKGISLGIMAVDNIVTRRPLTKSDMNLLMGVAYQTAVSIFSANSFKKLQSSEERYRSLYENAPTAYISIRVEDAVIVRCNSAAIRLFGFARDNLIGSSIWNHVASSNEGRQRWEWVHDLLQKGLPVHNESIELMDADKRSIWVNISMEPFKDATGRLIEGRCILVDTTKQKYLEEKLQYAQRMETIGTLAGGVAHDLSNILSAIVSYPDLMLMDIELDSPLYDPIMKIKGAGHRASAIVQDLLTLSRRGVPITDVIDLNAMVKAFMHSPELDDLKAHHPGIDIVTDLKSESVLIKGSQVHILKTIMNIVYNAAEAITDKGVISLKTKTQSIKSDDLRLKSKPGKYAVLLVEDNGHGIAPDDLKRVFEPFFTKKVMGRSGTGLGMAIVWAAVEDHKGFIDIDSEVRQGTKVKIFFPITSEKLVQSHTASVPMQYADKGDEVMVVDDDSEHREIAMKMLRRLGYSVVGVDSGESAVYKFEDNYRPDIVILDMELGNGLDGLKTYQRISKIHPGQKAIITSGYSESSRVKKALELGVGAYVKKPYSLKDISTAVRYEIEH